MRYTSGAAAVFVGACAALLCGCAGSVRPDTLGTAQPENLTAPQKKELLKRLKQEFQIGSPIFGTSPYGLVEPEKSITFTFTVFQPQNMKGEGDIWIEFEPESSKGKGTSTSQYLDFDPTKLKAVPQGTDTFPVTFKVKKAADLQKAHCKYLQPVHFKLGFKDGNGGPPGDDEISDCAFVILDEGGEVCITKSD